MWCSDPDEFKFSVVDFYKSLFTGSGGSGYDYDYRNAFPIADPATLQGTGDGRSIKFWLDNWLGDLGPLVVHATRLVDIFLLYKTVADMVDGDGSWRWGQLDGLLSPLILARIADVKGPTHGSFPIPLVGRVLLDPISL
ncbi:hypothetical protein V6N13_125810 [Hibiscus sabdariffa]